MTFPLCCRMKSEQPEWICLSGDYIGTGVPTMRDVSFLSTRFGVLMLSGAGFPNFLSIVFLGQATWQHVGRQPANHAAARVKLFGVVADETGVVDDKRVDGGNKSGHNMLERTANG